MRGRQLDTMSTDSVARAIRCGAHRRGWCSRAAVAAALAFVLILIGRDGRAQPPAGEEIDGLKLVVRVTLQTTTGAPPAMWALALGLPSWPEWLKSTSHATFDVFYYLSALGKRTEIAWTGGSGATPYVLEVRSTGQVWIVDPAKRSLRLMGDQRAAVPPWLPEPEIVKTGQTTSILGIAAQRVIVRQRLFEVPDLLLEDFGHLFEGSETVWDLWLAPSLSEYARPVESGTEILHVPPVLAEVLEGGLILRHRVRVGSTELSAEAVEVRKGSFDRKLFEVPDE